MSGEKTEQPTPKRLRDAREKGEVAKSQEIPAAAIVLLAAGYFIVMSEQIFADIADFTEAALAMSAAVPFEQAWPQLKAGFIGLLLSVVLPLVALVITASVLSNVAQIGFLFAPKAAAPKLQNLSPQKWFKHVFSKKNLFDFCKNLAKVIVLGVAVGLALRNHFRELFMIPNTGNIGALWTVMGGILRDLAMYAVMAFAFIAIIDLLYTKAKFTKDHMMSPDEVKREYKESEGDPMIKQKRKQIHQEMANQNTLGKTRKAKVLVVNPVHYAVALDYGEDSPLPRIVAKGEGDLAKRMIEVAKQENIPVMREPPLARALFAQGREDDFIPDELLAPVATVLRFVAGINRGEI